ncbi:MAG: cohesin domain-containing protein [Betaproteobacteria bacterium]|jgi:hypothetical protein
MIIPRLIASLRNAALGVLIGAAGLGSVHAAVVSVFASQSSVQVGGNVSLQFEITGLTASSLGAFDFDLVFDSTVLAFTAFSFDDNVTGRNQLDLAEPGSFAFFGDATAAGGVVDAFAASGNSRAKLDDEQTENFRFLTLTFTGLAASSGTTLAVNLLDPNLVFSDAAGGLLSYSFQNSAATIAVTAGSGGTVSEPGALLLVLLALAVAWVATNRRRSVAADGPSSLPAHFVSERLLLPRAT